MRIVLNQKRKEYVIKEPVPNERGTNAFRANKHKFEKHMDDILDVRCLVLATMTPELQKQHEYMVAYEMIQNLKEILKGKHENREFLSNKGNGRNIELKEVQQQQVHEPEVEETPQIIEENSTDLETQPLRRSTRERHEPERYVFLVTTHGDVILVDQDESKTYQEAVSSSDSEKWLEAMRSEMDSMSENQVWSLVKPPEGIKPIGCKWVSKKKSIYGLKQASQSWNLCFNDAIKEFGFIRNEDEPCVYKKFSGSIVSFLILYVDDILIIGNDIPTLQSIKTWLSSCFSMKDLGEATYILGVKIYRDRSRRLLGLSQSTYIDKVLKWFSIRGFFLPMRHGISLSKEMCPSTPQERERMSQIPYASTIGSVMYAMICTRPDLSYALSMTSRYQSNPGEGHWTTVKNIIKYLRRTKDVFLVYGDKEELGIKGYIDASFQTDKMIHDHNQVLYSVLMIL
ncbi:hypothetical protein V6N13_148560 [Hibiscus sabdariffa]